jgi:hypothetical protein
MFLQRTFFSIAAVALTLSSAQADLAPVPVNLQVPEDFRPFLAAAAEGTQNYICVPSGTGYAWALFGPQATLFDGDEQIVTHFLSANPAENGTPRATWQSSRDTSRAWAVAIANSTDPNYVAPNSIPWLLLQVVGTQNGPHNGDRMTAARYIQRINTSGGLAPASGCAASNDAGKKALVPYTAEYVFYKERE